MIIDPFISVNEDGTIFVSGTFPDREGDVIVQGCIIDDNFVIPHSDSGRVVFRDCTFL